MNTGYRPPSLIKPLYSAVCYYSVSAILVSAILYFTPLWISCYVLYIISFFFFTSLLAGFVEKWIPKRKLPIEGKAVFITGCDSGFGYTVAQRLDDIGYHVFAGCLFPKGPGAENLKKGSSDRLRIVDLDVTKDESVERALQFVKNNLNGNKMWAVINNAGLNDGGEVAWTPVEVFKRLYEVNTFGVVRVTRAFLPMIRKSQGRVVVVCSASGRMTFPGLVPYSMTKHSVVSFCDGLRHEMYRWGVQVISIEPWMYKTHINNDENVLGYMKRTWEKASEESKEGFPPNYPEIHQKTVSKFLNYSTSPHLEEVVACMEEAITAETPSFSYMPGTRWFRMNYWIGKRIPQALFGYFLFHNFLVDEVPFWKNPFVYIYLKINNCLV